MSRNFELLQQAQIGATRLSGLPDEGHATASETDGRASDQELRADEAAVCAESLKLVQRLFLSPQESKANKVVTFATVDSASHCDQLCIGAAKALAMSVSGSVCLLDADFHTSSQSEMLGCVKRRVLIDALREDRSIRYLAKVLGPDNLWFLARGESGGDEANVFENERMQRSFGELRKEFEYVLIQAPPLSLHADGLVLGRLSDGVVLILEANKTRREAAMRAAESLRGAKIPVLGAVLNNRTFPIPEALYKRI